VRHSVVDGRDERRRGGSAGGRWLPFKGAVGDNREGGGSGSGDATWCRGTWGLAPTDGRRPDRGARGRRVPLFQQWRADAADARAPAGGRRESEEWGAGRAWAGPEKREVGRAQMNSSI
jgi:hypothetical protein